MSGDIQWTNPPFRTRRREKHFARPRRVGRVSANGTPGSGWGGSAADLATAGTPGTFSPAFSPIPADIAAMAGVTASPATAWTTGQSVTLGDASSAYWDSADWQVGTAP